MGKAVGAIAGGLSKAVGLGSGVKKGLQGYDAQIGATQAGRDEALGFLDPYTNVGQGALGQLSTLVTGQSYDPETGEMIQVNPEDRFASFQASPGYQFRMDEGLRALQNSQARKGNIYSGGALKELINYGQGQASTEYGNYLGNLQNLAGAGQVSAGQSANVATGAATQIGQARLGQGNLRMQGSVLGGQNVAEMFGSFYGGQEKKK